MVLSHWLAIKIPNMTVVKFHINGGGGKEDSISLKFYVECQEFNDLMAYNPIL